MTRRLSGTERRAQYAVLPTTKGERLLVERPWKVTRDGGTIAVTSTKAEAVELATTTARCAWETQGQRAELTIKARNGRIQDRRTYGADPTSSKG